MNDHSRTQMEDDRPIYVANDRKDGGLRDDWKEAAEVIAHIEGGIALSRLQRKRAGLDRPSGDATPAGVRHGGQAQVAWRHR